MGTLGYIVGGALQGIGGAMGQQAQADADQRRQIALENLRQQNTQSNMRMQADLNDDLARNQDMRDITKEGHKFQLDIIGKKLDHGYTLDELSARSKMNLDNTLAEISARAGVDASQVSSVEPGGDGFYYVVTKNGSIRKTDMPVPEKQLETSGSASGTGGALDRVLNARGAGAGIGSGSTAAPAAPTKAPAPAKPASKPAAAKPAPVKPGSRGTISMTQVDQMAKEAGYTRAEALRYAENLGYRVQTTPAAKPKPDPSLQKRWEMGLSGQTK